MQSTASPPFVSFSDLGQVRSELVEHVTQAFFCLGATSEPAFPGVSAFIPHRVQASEAHALAINAAVGLLTYSLYVSWPAGHQCSAPHHQDDDILVIVASGVVCLDATRARDAVYMSAWANEVFALLGHVLRIGSTYAHTDDLQSEQGVHRFGVQLIRVAARHLQAMVYCLGCVPMPPVPGVLAHFRALAAYWCRLKNTTVQSVWGHHLSPQPYFGDFLLEDVCESLLALSSPTYEHSRPLAAFVGEPAAIRRVLGFRHGGALKNTLRIGTRYTLLIDVLLDMAR